MHSFPRLTALFGAPVHALTHAHIAEAVTRKIPEAEDLDFKQALYGNTTEAKQELTKDVSALANAGGGVLILGIAEQNAAADALTPLPLTAGEAERMKKICHYQIRPFLPGVHIDLVPETSDPSTGYYVISVPRSADAPHAVIRGGNDNGDGTLLSYALRDGQVTRWLAEAEIARRYRDRFTSRAELAAALDQVHDEGATRINAGDTRSWLTMAAYPNAAGTQRVGGSETITQIFGEVQDWGNATPSMPGRIFDDWVMVFPGVRRAVVTASSSYHVTLNQEFADLHFNGAGFAACPTPMVPLRQGEEDPWPAQIAQDMLELRLHSMVSLLSNHAARSGAGGDFEFCAQLRLAPHYSWSGSHRTTKPTALHAPTQGFHGGPIDEYEVPQRSISPNTEFLHARTTTSLEELAESWQSRVRAAHALAVDILGHFAVADALVLRADGTFNTAVVNSKRAAQITEWADNQPTS